MKAETEAVLEAFGKNEQVKNVFRALVAALAGRVLAPVPATITGCRLTRVRQRRAKRAERAAI